MSKSKVYAPTARTIETDGLFFLPYLLVDGTTPAGLEDTWPAQ